MPYLYGLFVVFAVLIVFLVFLFRAVAGDSPHVRLAPLSTPKDGESQPQQHTGFDVPPQERETLLVYAARYSLEAFNSFLSVTYPHLAAKAATTKISRSILLRLNGTSQQPPVLCVARLNAQDAALHGFGTNPFFFCGAQSDGQCRAVAMLDALESLLAHNVIFRHNIWLVFLPDLEDAQPLVDAFQQQHASFCCVLCEGGRIAPFGRNRANRIAAVGIGVRKKVRLQLHTASASTDDPDAENALSILARALLRIQKKPLRVHPGPDMLQFGRYALYENSFFSRIVAMSPHCFMPTFSRLLVRYGGKECLRDNVRILHMQGECPDLYSAQGQATLLCTLCSHTSVSRIQHKLQRRIHDDRVALTAEETDNTSVFADVHGVWFRAVQKAVALSFPNTNAAPVVLIDAPLAQLLQPLCDCTLAFSADADDGLGAETQRIFFENFFQQLR